jgi:hypothetical protein
LFGVNSELVAFGSSDSVLALVFFIPSVGHAGNEGDLGTVREEGEGKGERGGEGRGKETRVQGESWG